MKEVETSRAMIPLYVRGVLSGPQRKEFEKLLEGNPELREEVDQWKRIGDAYKKMESQLPLPSGGVYSQIAEKINAGQQKSFFDRILPSPAFSFALIAAQFLIIMALLIYVAGDRDGFKTLSAPANGSGRINVVFKQDVSEAAIRTLLVKVNGKIVDGPYSSGLYVIGLPSDNEVNKALTEINESGLVVMAERAY